MAPSAIEPVVLTSTGASTSLYNGNSKEQVGDYRGYDHISKHKDAFTFFVAYQAVTTRLSVRHTLTLSSDSLVRRQREASC